VTGRILWQSPDFEPGMLVDAGEPLLRIDPTDYELALAEAKQALASANCPSPMPRPCARPRAWTRPGNRRRGARTDRPRRARPRNTEISAPYAAVIDEQRVEVGQFIARARGRAHPGRGQGRGPTARSRRRISALSTSTATPPSACTPSPASGSGAGRRRLARIEARVDEQTRVFPVVVEVEEPLNVNRTAPAALRPFVRAEIAGGSLTDAVRMPQSALHGDDDVFLFVDGQLQRRSVTVGRISDGNALVTADWKTATEVVTTRST
jgi:multidrug efflux pump subunit AcrA (membrane-fusion protein)